MAKRSSDTEIWKKKWYCDLSPAMKCFWKYICDSCDNAGVWEINIPLAEFQIGCKLELSDIINDFNGNIYQLSETKLHVRDFVQFQCGELSDSNNFHKSIISLLNKHGISAPDQPLTSPTSGALVIEEKSKSKRKVKEEFIEPTFQEFSEYCISNGFSSICDRAFKGYEVANWHDAQGKQILNWKQKLQNGWFREENKDKPKSEEKPKAANLGLAYIQQEFLK